VFDTRDVSGVVLGGADAGVVGRPERVRPVVPPAGGRVRRQAGESDIAHNPGNHLNASVVK
jgi:hypothetical protein